MVSEGGESFDGGGEGYKSTGDPIVSFTVGIFSDVLICNDAIGGGLWCC